MLNEFYNYIANNTLCFFQSKGDALQYGERYCLKLDTEEMVKGVDDALRNVTGKNNIQGSYSYGNVYSTFTLKISDKMQVVVAAKRDGMTDDFLATLRNAELTENRFPILMITHSAIDTITSGTGDLAAKGMPFHVQSIIEKIKEDISKAQLSVADRTLLAVELKRKQSDRYSDKSSLFEYSDLLTVLGRGYVVDEDYPSFSLLIDPTIKNMVDPKKIISRLEDNHKFFEEINRVYKHGNIQDELGNEFDKDLVKQIATSKKNSLPWHENLTYDLVKASQDKLKKKLDNPLEIVDTGISAYHSSPVMYNFGEDTLLFVRCDGETKAKQSRKNILIFNPDLKDEVTISIDTNIYVKPSWVEECVGATFTTSSREVSLMIKPTGCSFAYAKIQDTNNKIVYILKICVLNILPEYLENIQTSYILALTKSIKNGKIQIFGLKDSLLINPNRNVEDVKLEQGKVLDATHDKTLNVLIGEEAIDSDTGTLDCLLKVGNIEIPLQIQDEPVKPTELTGVSAFKLKHSLQKSLEYRAGNKIVVGTKEYFARDPFKSSLEIEQLFIDKQWLAIRETIDGAEECKLDVAPNIHDAYQKLLEEFRKLRTVPSLAFYKKDSDLYRAAYEYVSAIEYTFEHVQEGQSLSNVDNQTLLIGCVVKNSDEKTIEMSPLHPLNILYQLKLLEENQVGEVRENLVEKLTALYLLPFVKDSDKILYHAIEQKHSPEWRYYAPASNRRYLGARNFVQKLVCDKINQYKEHFSFLFDDICNRLLCINLINMGDCREIFRGFIRYYVQSAKDGIDYDDMLSFDVKVYAKKGSYNEFSLLADMHKLKQAIKDSYGAKELEDASELALVMTSKIRCFYKNPDETEYEYAHLTFYEMASSEDTGASRMEAITTGISLGGITSGTPSVLNADWYKTGFGTKYADAKNNQLIRMAAYYNAMFRVAFSGSCYEPDSSIFTEIEQGQEGQLGKIYKSSNWVVFVDPKVDLSFFQKKSTADDEAMIIHYSDQYTSASGYDDITVTQKSNQYNEIISDQLQKKGITANSDNINGIISLFNAINGGWMLRLITAKKLTGAADSYFSREKMSILSAIKLCMAYYNHPNITWVPISLEEMLRVSGGAGLSQKDGMLSAKNLGFEQRATSDDILLVGIEGPKDNIKIYLHPVEVKIGLNQSAVIDKAKEQVKNTFNGLHDALWPDIGRDSLERKLSRNFFMQLILVCCEKLKLYKIYPDENWDAVLDEYRENLLNERYTISDAMDEFIGRGTVVSFGTNVLNKSGELNSDGICLIEMPEKLGSSYMVLSAKEIGNELDLATEELPKRFKKEYRPAPAFSVKNSFGDAAETPGNITYISNRNLAEDSIGKVAEEPVQYETGDSQFESEVSTKDEVTEEIPVTPVEIKEGMQVLFGTDITNGEPLHWCPNDTEQIFHTNTGIIGTMGTGKTQFTKSMITQLYQNRKDNFGSGDIGILIFDYKGDYNESKEDFIRATDAKVLKPYHLPFNPLSLTKSKVFKPLLPTHTANAFKDTLSKVYSLGPKQQNTLFQCIIDAYAARGIMAANPATWDNTPPTFDMVYSLYSNNDDIKKNDSLAAAMDKLYQFQVFEGNASKTQSLFDLLKGVVVIDLSGYDADIQSLIVAITLDLFYSQMQAAGSSELNNKYRQITKLILVDEADNFMSEGFPALKKILKEGREFGVGTILSTQFLKHFGSGEDDYSKYILTWVVHNVADLKSADVEFVLQVEGKSADSQTLYNDIKGLNKHYSIVKIGNSKPKYIHDKAFWELYKSMFLDE
ncbi:MAG: DNA phosphorothioation-dependent restriction protein DptH [Aminipila sp.]